MALKVYVRKGLHDQTRIVSFNHEGYDLKKLRACGFIPDGTHAIYAVTGTADKELPKALEEIYQAIEALLDVELEFA